MNIDIKMEEVLLYLVDERSKRVFHTDICLVVPHWVDSFLFLLTSVERRVTVVLLDENIRITGPSSVHSNQLSPAQDGHLHPEVGAAAQQLLLLGILQGKFRWNSIYFYFLPSL